MHVQQREDSGNMLPTQNPWPDSDAFGPCYLPMYSKCDNVLSTKPPNMIVDPVIKLLFFMLLVVVVQLVNR